MPDLRSIPAAVRSRAEPYVERGRASILGQVWGRMLEMTFVETAVALAAKAFVALFPLLVIVAAVAPDFVRLGIVSALKNRMGIDGATGAYVEGAFRPPDQARAATGLFGLVFLFFYATFFTSALQRIYLRAWRRPRRGGLTNQGRGFLWIVGVIVFFALLGSLRRSVTGIPATGAFLILAVSTSFLLWWWTAWVLLRGDVRWRVLVPGAVLTSLSMLIYAASSDFWMPRTVRENSDQFGFFGVALALVSWFTGMAFIIVAAAAANAVLAEDTGLLGRWTRGRVDAVLLPAAPPALPGPARDLRLRDAVALSEDTT